MERFSGYLIQVVSDQLFKVLKIKGSARISVK